MGILEKLKSVLGLDGRSGSTRPTDPDVTVEREPSAESERAVKGTTPSDAPRAPRSAGASSDASEGRPSDAAGSEDSAESGGPDAAEAAAGEPSDTSSSDDDGAEVAVSDEAAADAPSPGVEEINGIGPTFAERLQAAGIETVADLAETDAASLAEAAETHESRVEDWLEQARDF